MLQQLMPGRDIFEEGRVENRSTQQQNHTADERVEYEHIPQTQVPSFETVLLLQGSLCDLSNVTCRDF